VNKSAGHDLPLLTDSRSDRPDHDETVSEFTQMELGPLFITVFRH